MTENDAVTDQLRLAADELETQVPTGWRVKWTEPSPHWRVGRLELWTGQTSKCRAAFWADEGELMIVIDQTQLLKSVPSAGVKSLAINVAKALIDGRVTIRRKPPLFITQSVFVGDDPL